MLIDTHCHLTDEAFREDVDAVIARARAAGVERMVLACCDAGELPGILSLCRRYPHVLYPALGLHPENLLADYRPSLDALRAQLDSHAGELIAIGEVGLDLHWDRHRLDDQLAALGVQVEWAVDHDLPLLLHIRDAMPAFLQALPVYDRYAHGKGRRLRGVLHCYNGTADEALEALRWGDFLFGIGGILTYKHSATPDVARAIGLGRILLETDAPYLAPVPHRGKRNEPAFTADTARALADVLGTSLADVADTTTQNAEKLFHFDAK